MNGAMRKRNSEWARWGTRVESRKEEWGSASLSFVISLLSPLSFLTALRLLHSIAYFLLQSVESCLDKRAIEGEPFSCSGVFFRFGEGMKVMENSGRRVFMVGHSVQGCVFVFTFGIVKDSGTVIRHPPLDNFQFSVEWNHWGIQSTSTHPK